MLPLTPDPYGGRRLGKYEVLCRLSTGGMAEIFLASQRGLAGFRKLVVLKQILPDIRGEEEFVRMFLDEAKVTAAFNHPNIAQVFDLDIAEGELFLAMEFVPGATLVEVAKAARAALGGIPIGLTLAAVRDTAVALHYAHTFTDPLGQPSPVIHRDIAEKNIMVTYEGVTKLLDFGIAKSLARAGRTQVGTVKGTSGYMSPEQILGEPLDARSDLFSLGVVLHECLTGMRLFYGRTPDAAMNAVLQGQVPPPSRTNKAVPPEVDAIVLKALARKREERYASTLEFARALERSVGGLIWHPEQSGELMVRLFAERREQTRQLLAAGQLGSADITGEIRLSQLFGGDNPFASQQAPAEPPAPPPAPTPTRSTAAATPPPAPPPPPEETLTGEPPAQGDRSPTPSRGSAAPRRSQTATIAAVAEPGPTAAAPRRTRSTLPTTPPPEEALPSSAPPTPRRAQSTAQPQPPPAEDEETVTRRAPVDTPAPRRAAPPSEPSRTSRTEDTARTLVAGPEERQPPPPPRASATRAHPAVAVEAPGASGDTPPRGGATRRVRRMTQPLPASRDSEEESTITVPAVNGVEEQTEFTLPGAYTVEEDASTITAEKDDAEQVEHTVPGVRIPLPENAAKAAPKRRGRMGLYAVAALVVVAILGTLVVLRLDGGLISSALPTFSDLTTTSGHDPGALRPLPESVKGTRAAPPPRERPLPQAPEQKTVAQAAPDTQPPPATPEPEAQAEQETPAQPPSANAEDNALTPLELEPESAVAQPSEPDTQVKEAPAAETPRPTKRSRPPKKSVKRGTSSTSTASAEESRSGKAQDDGEPGLLTLIVEPYAKVYLGGRLLGETPLFKMSLPSGRHVLRLVGPDGNPRRLSVEIKPGDTTSLRMPLELLARE